MSNKIFFKIIVLFYSIISINIVNANELNPEAKNKLVERANKYRAEGNYDAAIIQLDSILAANPKDAGILLYKGDLKLQSKRFKDAIDVYRSILPLNFEKTIVQINLSYALFMNHHPAQALAYAQKAWEENKTNNSAIVNHFNAMLWNIQDKKAKQFLNSQTSQLSPAQNLVLNARLETTRGNFKKGLELYDSLVQLYPNKHYLMEYVEVLIGKKELKTARIF
jgi:tetratricopeptide (TPR) repeat protein